MPPNTILHCYDNNTSSCSCRWATGNATPTLYYCYDYNTSSCSCHWCHDYFHLFPNLCTMNPDSSTMHPGDGSTVTNDAAPVDGSTNDHSTANAFCYLPNDPPPDDSFTNDFPTATGFDYSPDSVAFLNSIEKEAACLFPRGKIFVSPGELRLAIRPFPIRKDLKLLLMGVPSFADDATNQIHKRERGRRGSLQKSSL